MAAETRHAVADEKKPRRWLWWLGAVTLVAGVIAMASWQASRPIPYTRYVSPPLPDGRRETFLYPTELGQVRAFSFPMRRSGGTAYAVQYVTVMRSYGPIEQLAYRARFLRGVLHADDYESIMVMRTNDPDMFSRFPAGLSVTSQDGRYLRSEGRQSRRGGADHRVVMTDRQSAIRYIFSHRFNGTGLRRRFERDDPAIIASFQILSPGVAPPKP